MKAQPMDNFPKGRFILAKHKNYGWIEAIFDEAVYNQSIVLHGSNGGFAWSNPGTDNWMFHKDILAWAELPSEEIR